MRKKTHKEFLEELQTKNPLIFDQLEFIEEYAGATTKIKAMHKYGLIWATPQNIMKTTMILVKIAVDPSSFWVNKMKDLFDNDNTYEKVEYIKNHIYVIITCPIHGDFSITPANYQSGQGCRDCFYAKLSKEKTCTNEQFLKKVQYKNPVFFKEVKFVSPYVSNRKKMLFQTKHGLIKMTPSNILAGHSYNIDTAIDKDSYCISEFREVHGDIYDYSRVQYVNDSTKVEIVCAVHGSFWMTPSNHKQEHNCNDCAKERRGWSRTDYINMVGDRTTACYILRCWNDTEEFNKIGFSVNIKSRFKSKKAMPYQYQILHQFKGDPGFVFDKEKELHRQHREQGLKYKPKLPFKGDGECFSEILWDEINKEINKENSND